MCECGKKTLADNTLCDVCAVFADKTYDLPKNLTTPQQIADFELNYPVEQQWRDRAMTAIQRISAAYPPKHRLTK